MPEFDKDDYSKRRKKGLRGQGEIARVSHIGKDYGGKSHVNPTSEKLPGKYALRKNTKRARKAALNGI